MTQILNLNLLAPDMQERLLFLVDSGGEGSPLYEKGLRSVTGVVSWVDQRRSIDGVVDAGSDLDRLG